MYSPLNSYVYIHWILNFKCIVLLVFYRFLTFMLVACTVVRTDAEPSESSEGTVGFHQGFVLLLSCSSM